MKSAYPRIGLAKLCGWFGISRQAYYQHSWTAMTTIFEEDSVIKQVRAIRNKHPRIGTRKLYVMLQAFLTENGIKLGRDALFDLLASHHLLVRKRKRRIRTTNSFHWFKKYPNLIKDFEPTASNQLWVSDITYWKIDSARHFYISLITDTYSHKIVGHHVSETMEALEVVKALQRALSAMGAERLLKLIHHSDRGLPYCSSVYVKLLQDYGIQISMTENGDPRENAVAERVNGIIKDEYLENYSVKNLKEAKKLLDAVIALYNEERPHMNINNLVPNVLHENKHNVEITRLWKNYYRNQPTFVNLNQD